MRMMTITVSMKIEEKTRGIKIGRKTRKKMKVTRLVQRIQKRSMGEGTMASAREIVVKKSTVQTVVKMNTPKPLREVKDSAVDEVHLLGLSAMNIVMKMRTIMMSMKT